MLLAACGSLVTVLGEMGSSLFLSCHCGRRWWCGFVVCSCVLPRAPPLVEGMAALVLADLALMQRARAGTNPPVFGQEAHDSDGDSEGAGAAY